MSEVYQAKDTVLGRTVAVKLLTPQAATQEDTRARFLLEAKVSSGIAHENIITTHDYGEEDGIPYMVLEFLTGRTLKEALYSGEPLTLTQRVTIGWQLARALAHVHTLDLVHRDVKPDNVHIDAQGRVKLMDFGIVKSGDVTLTQAGYALGTPHYVAPELVRGQPVTKLVDVYSYGVLLFEVLAGKRAIQAETVETIFYQILHQDLSFEPMKEANVPEELQKIVRDATARDPQNRTQSMTAIITALEAWMAAHGIAVAGGTATTAIPTAPARQRVHLPNRWLAAATALSLVCAAGIGYLLLNSQKAVARVDDTLGEMAFVPAGPFLHGADKQQVHLQGFYIDLTEVTNEDYEEYCRATGRKLPDGFERGKPGYPIVNITVDEAKAYAAWAGKRLPTDREWQKAARGVDGRPYPWGDLMSPTHANVIDNPDDTWHHLVSVETFRLGRSPYLILQMIGNAREFTADTGTPTVADLRQYEAMVDPPARMDEPWVIVKGGSFQNKLEETSIHLGEVVPARYRAPDLGFRCVKDP